MDEKTINGKINKKADIPSERNIGFFNVKIELIDSFS